MNVGVNFTKVEPAVKPSYTAASNGFRRWPQRGDNADCDTVVFIPLWVNEPRAVFRYWKVGIKLTSLQNNLGLILSYINSLTTASQPESTNKATFLKTFNWISTKETVACPSCTWASERRLATPEFWNLTFGLLNIQQKRVVCFDRVKWNFTTFSPWKNTFVHPSKNTFVHPWKNPPLPPLEKIPSSAHGYVCIYA